MWSQHIGLWNDADVNFQQLTTVTTKVLKITNIHIRNIHIHSLTLFNALDKVFELKVERSITAGVIYNLQLVCRILQTSWCPFRKFFLWNIKYRQCGTAWHLMIGVIKICEKSFCGNFTIFCNSSIVIFFCMEGAHLHISSSLRNILTSPRPLTIISSPS